MDQQLESTTQTNNLNQPMPLNGHSPQQVETLPPLKRKRRTKAEMEKLRSQQLPKEEKVEDNQQENIGDISVSSTPKRTDKYVYVEKVLQALEIAYDTRKNILLYGLGGFSKSTLTIDFLLDKGIEPFVVTLGKGMTIDKLFGGLDLKKFQEDGKIEYLVENSFMNYEYVIFEEMFDAPDYILEQLKDVLSSRILRNGTQIFPLKTKFIIANTNHTRNEYAKTNRSLLALMERFPLEIEVQWKDYNEITYGNLLNSVKGYVNPMLTYVLEEFAKSGNIISPRIALEASDILDKYGPDCFEFIADFASKPEILKKALTKFKSIDQIVVFGKITEEYNKYMKDLILDDLKGSEIKEVIQYHNYYKRGLSKFKKEVIVDDSLTERKTSVLKFAENLLSTYNKKIQDYSVGGEKATNIDEVTGEEITSEKEINDMLEGINL